MKYGIFESRVEIKNLLWIWTEWGGIINVTCYNNFAYYLFVGKPQRK